MKTNRIRKQISTTIDSDILWCINAFTNSRCSRGDFIGNAISSWLSHQLFTLFLPTKKNLGLVVHLVECDYGYRWKEVDCDFIGNDSDYFKTYRSAFEWLKRKYPSLREPSIELDDSTSLFD